MLIANHKLHREFFTPNTPKQKLFLQLSLSPEWASKEHRPDLAVAFVIDTSGSMRDRVASRSGAAEPVSKLDLVMESMEAVLNLTDFGYQDRIALVSFDSGSRVNVSFLRSSKRGHLLAAVHSLSQYSGGTKMGAGLDKALRLLQNETASKRIILLSDGEAMDEEVVQTVSKELRNLHIPVTAIGVGDFNESLLSAVADRTMGDVMDIVADQANPEPPSFSAHQLPQAILEKMEQSAREVVTDMTLGIRTVKGVRIDRITRVAPEQNEVDLSLKPYVLGNAEHGTSTTFIIECTLPERPAVRMRLAQLSVTYQVPGANFRGESKPLDIVIEHTTDEVRLREIDSGVMQFVQQRNIEGMIKRATQQAADDPATAAKTLRLAHNLTQKLGNRVMTKVLDRALDELETNKTISLGTAKTMRMGSKTQTIKSNDLAAMPSDDEIRKLTGA